MEIRARYSGFNFSLYRRIGTTYSMPIQCEACIVPIRVTGAIRTIRKIRILIIIWCVPQQGKVLTVRGIVYFALLFSRGSGGLRRS